MSLEVEVPARLYRRINKKTLRSKDVDLVGAIWDKAVIFCQQCGWGHR